jgi:hypothetical protein
MRMAEAVGVDVGFAWDGDSKPEGGARARDPEDAAKLMDAAGGGVDGAGGGRAIGDGVNRWRWWADGGGDGWGDGDAAKELGGGHG